MIHEYTRQADSKAGKLNVPLDSFNLTDSPRRLRGRLKDGWRGNTRNMKRQRVSSSKEEGPSIRPMKDHDESLGVHQKPHG